MKKFAFVTSLPVVFKFLSTGNKFESLLFHMLICLDWVMYLSRAPWYSPNRRVRRSSTGQLASKLGKRQIFNIAPRSHTPTVRCQRGLRMKCKSYVKYNDYGEEYVNVQIIFPNWFSTGYETWQCFIKCNIHMDS